MKTSRILIAFLLSAVLPATAQTARLYTSENGLLNTQINRIYQDGKGFIWVATEGGLLRFDEVGFETFRHDRENANSLPSDSVHDILEDSHGTKWVATASGLARFESEYNRFLLYNLQDARNGASTQFIDRILELPNRVSGSSLYICTSGFGVYVIDPQTGTLQDNKRERLYKHLPSEYISNLYLDSDRHLWILPADVSGTVILDADSLDPATDITWAPDLARDSGQYRITAIAEDPLSRNLLLATAENGLLLYDAATRSIRRARGTGSRTVSATAAIYNTFSGQEDGRSFLLGNENGGLLFFDIDTESVRPGSLPSIRQESRRWKATALLGDNQGNLWLGLYQTGLMVAPR